MNLLQRPIKVGNMLKHVAADEYVKAFIRVVNQLEIHMRNWKEFMARSLIRQIFRAQIKWIITAQNHRNARDRLSAKNTKIAPRQPTAGLKVEHYLYQESSPPCIQIMR